MKVLLCDLNPAIAAEWNRAFAKWLNKEVYVACGDILKYKADAVCSPSNSYMEFSGGVDLAYYRHFGPTFQDKLQDMIKQRPMKELLVGEALVVPTGNDLIPNLIATPTMRVPLDISATSNVYLAFKAALIAAKQHNFQTILAPGFGTLTGQVEPMDAARQMATAYADFVDKYPKHPSSLREAALLYQNLVGITNMKGLRR